MVGDLDYSLLRHAGTPISDKELKYSENDVRVVMAYIQESIENCGDITRIPLTKTGYVRAYCRNACMYDGSHKNNVFKYMQYRRLMCSLQLSPDEYRALKRAFRAVSYMRTRFIQKDCRKRGFVRFHVVISAVMVSKIPYVGGGIVEIKSRAEFERNLMLYCCLFDVEFIDIEATNCLSIRYRRHDARQKVWSKTTDVSRSDANRTTITEQDFLSSVNFIAA